jgi:hypothetical protein
VPRRDVLHHEVRLGAILQLMIPAITLALARDGTKRDPPGLEEQHDLGPLMPHDTSLAMMKCLGVCRMQTRAMLERTLHHNRHIPGQLCHFLPGVGHWLRWLLREALQRSDGALAMGLQPLRAWGCMPSGKPGGFRERRVPGHDHQKHEGTRADVCQTSTDQDMPGAPSRHRLCSHVASPMSRWRCGERRRRSRFTAEGASHLCQRRSVCYPGVSLPVIRKRGGDGDLHDVRSERGYATGRWVLPTRTPSGSRKPGLLGICCFSGGLGTGQDFPATFKLICLCVVMPV